MIFPQIAIRQKPNRLTEKKDKDYHIAYGKWVLAMANDRVLLYNIYKYIVNWNFYKGNQWIFNEDLEPFLKDENNDVRNRIRWAYNIVKPMVRMYTGNAVKATFNVRGYNVSKQVIDEKEIERTMRMYAHKVMDAMPLLQDSLKKEFNLGETPQETEEIFDNTFIDKTELRVNALFRRQERLNKFEWLQEENAKDLALAGVSVLKYNFNYGDMRWERIDAPYFIYDTGAQMQDLSDIDYAGDISLHGATDLMNYAQDLTKEEMNALEEYARFSMNMNTQYESLLRLFAPVMGKIPKYNLYWHDTEIKEYGYILDEDSGMYIKMLINDDATTYKSKDVVRRSELPENLRNNVNKEGIQRMQKDVVRYIEMTPSELINGANIDDVVYRYGIMPYDDFGADATYNNRLPYRIATYDYRYGEMLTPVDDVIDPQRMMNRYLSMMEAALNNVRGANVFYDKNIVADEEDGEAGLLRKMNQSKPIGVDASRYGGNLQNAVIPYNGAEGVSQANNLSAIVETMRRMSQNITGINDDMTGLGDGNKKLVGVQENNIIRGSLMQESFYSAISRLWISVYDCIGNLGRKYYADNKIKIVEILGKGAIDEITFTKEMKLHQIHVELRRVSNTQTEIDYVNGQLLQFLQMGLIGENQFARLYNRAEVDQVSDAIIEYTKEKQMMAQEAQQDAKEQEMVAIQQQGAMQDREDNRAMMKADAMRDVADSNNTAKLIAQMQQRQQAKS